MASSAVEALHHKAYEMSSFTGVHGNSRALRQQLIRCHALVVQEQGQGEGAGQGEGEGEAAGVLCMRINTLAAYAEASRAVGSPHQPPLTTHPSPHIPHHTPLTSHHTPLTPNHSH